MEVATYACHRERIREIAKDALKWCGDKKKRISVIRSYEFCVTFPQHMLVLSVPEHPMRCSHQTDEAVKAISYEQGLKELFDFFNLGQFVEYGRGINEENVLSALHSGGFTVCRFRSSLPRWNADNDCRQLQREERFIIGFQSDEQAIRYLNGPMGRFMKPMIADETLKYCRN